MVALHGMQILSNIIRQYFYYFAHVYLFECCQLEQWCFVCIFHVFSLGDVMQLQYRGDYLSAQWMNDVALFSCVIIKMLQMLLLLVSSLVQMVTDPRSPKEHYGVCRHLYNVVQRGDSSIFRYVINPNGFCSERFYSEGLAFQSFYLKGHYSQDFYPEGSLFRNLEWWPSK